MPIRGGVPKRVSFENSRVRVHSWDNPMVKFYLVLIISSAQPTMGLAQMSTQRPWQRPQLPLIDAIEGTRPAARVIRCSFRALGYKRLATHARVYRGGAKGESGDLTAAVIKKPCI